MRSAEPCASARATGDSSDDAERVPQAAVRDAAFSPAGQLRDLSDGSDADVALGAPCWQYRSY